MTRMNIDFGIDLGTTNSAIAVLKGMGVEVIKNNEGFEYTPSAVWIDKSGKIHVGMRAYARLEDDSENARGEFKLQMGTTTEYAFARSGRRMKPEELSAEVLKALKGDVQQRTGEVIRAAVITVPAAFELHQCEATKKAAELAGLGFSPLLQEPVAAALAHGFQTESDKVFWFIYDFGGGTFDAAVMQVRDGVIQVVNHGGDNHLGGKLIDWEIVDKLLIPALLKERQLTDFRRNNPRWAAAIAKLKLNAEQAKIRLSRDETADIMIDHLCEDDRKEAVRFDFELKRSDVVDIAVPYILRSINIGRKVLSEKRLNPGDIEKIILVGGPTLAPYVREQLLDKAAGLGIPLDFSIDPLTVVARGAAVFAGTQRIETPFVRPTQAGHFAIRLDYKPIDTDTEPLVGGLVAASEAQDLSRYTIEFINPDSRPLWRSGKVGLSPEGRFTANLFAEKGRENVFQIELCDSHGQKLAVEPDRCSYRIGALIDRVPLTHSVGVGLADNTMHWFFEKGMTLPTTRQRSILRNAFDVRVGHAAEEINIPVKEGMNKRADRNTEVGNLRIGADMIKRDVPAGSEVEVTIQIDESRITHVKAYIPLLDEEFMEDIKHMTGGVAPDAKSLGQDFDKVKARLDGLRKKVEDSGDPEAKQAVQKIDGERMVHDVEAALAASSQDRDAADKCKKRLLDLAVALDEAEAALQWPMLLKDSEKAIKDALQILHDHGASEDREQLSLHEKNVQAAIQARDSELLEKRIAEIRGLVWRALDKKGILQIIWFRSLSDEKSKMTDPGKAEALISQGQKAMSNNDYEGLRTVNAQLANLLPSPPPPPGLGTLTH